MANSPSLPSARRYTFYGWWMVPVAIFGFVSTVPGQSVGVAAFNQIWREDLNLSSSQLSGLYAVGTIFAAVFLPLTGIAMDRWGIRWTTSLVVLGLAIACGWMSMVQGSWSLLVAFFLLRFLGQGSLSLLSNNTLAMWFHDRLGAVAGCSNLLVTLVMGLAPLILGWGISHLGWRFTYQLMGVAILCVMLPPLLTWFRNRPEDVGQRPDGKSISSEEIHVKPDAVLHGLTWKEAARTRSYWILILISMSWALIGTGLIFNVQPLYQEKARGLLSPEFAVTYFFTAVAISQLVGGFLADRFPLHRLMLAATIGMCCSLLLLWTFVGISFFIAYTLYGVVQGIIQAVGSTVWVRYYGRKNIGKIKSGAMMAMVAGSSVGPLVMSLAKDLGWTFNLSMLGFLILAGINGLAAVVLRPPVAKVACD